MVKPNRSCTFRMTKKIDRHIWPYMGKYGHIWPWFRSQRHSKAIVFQHFVAKKAYGSCWKKTYMATFACTKCIAVMTKKNSRSRMTKKTWIFGVPGKQMLSNFFSSERRKRLSLRKRFASQRCPLRTAASDVFPRSSEPSFNDWQWHVDTFPGTSSRQSWTCFWCGRWALSRNQMQPMDLNARFDGHGHGSVVSIPAVQLFPSNETPVFVEGWSRNIGAEGILSNQASNGLESFGIHLQWERFEFAKARTGSPFGTAVQIQKGANEDQTLKSLEFVSQNLYILERSPEGNQAALGEAGNRACQHLCETLMHAFARSLKTQHLKYLRKCADQFHMVQDIALISARCRNAAGWTHESLSSRPVVSKHIQRQWVIDTRLAAFNLRVAALHFQMTDCSIEDLEVKSRWARTTTLGLPIIWWMYTLLEGVLCKAFNLQTTDTSW